MRARMSLGQLGRDGGDRRGAAAVLLTCSQVLSWGQNEIAGKEEIKIAEFFIVCSEIAIGRSFGV